MKLRGLLRGETFAATAIGALCFRAPLYATAAALIFGDGIAYWARALVVTEVVTLQIYAVFFVLRLIENWAFRRRGLEAPKERSGWYFAVFIGLLPPALLGAGLRAGELFAKACGWPSRPVSFQHAREAIAFCLAFATVSFVIRLRFRAKDTEGAAKERVRALELGKLTGQIDAHMLFNALNTLAALVRKDPEAAENVVVELAELYQGVLHAHGSETHSLAEELRLCEAYLAVERARLGSRLRARIEVDPELDARSVRVPILLLQPFIENAVRHGIGARASGGNVVLRIATSGAGDSVSVHVEDDGVGMGGSPRKGHGIALANSKERLALAFGDAARLDIAARDEGGTCVTIAIPHVSSGPLVAT